MEGKLELLTQVPLFADVPRDVLVKLADLGGEADVPAGSALTHEGRHEGYFFVVESGSVRIERGGRVINTLGPGDFFGSVALVDAGPRTATAIAAEPTRVLSITNEQFRSLLDESPELRDVILKAAEHNLQTIDDETGA